MSFAGFICEVDGKPRSPQDCLACALKGSLPGCQFTPPILRGIVQANLPRGYTGWSVTQLTACPRKVRLRIEHPWHEKPSQLYYSWRGQIAHGIVEGAHGLDQVLAEMRFSAEVDGTLVSGMPDVVYVAHRHLQDYKTTKEVPGPWYVYTCPVCGKVMQEGRWKLARGKRKTCPHCKAYHTPKVVRAALTQLPPKPYSGHVAQVSVYRWLLHQNGVEVDTAEIVYLDMASVKRLPVTLWSLRRTEEWIRSRLPALVAPDLPPRLAKDDDDVWQCKCCPVSDLCRRLKS